MVIGATRECKGRDLLFQLYTQCILVIGEIDESFFLNTVATAHKGADYTGKVLPKHRVRII